MSEQKGRVQCFTCKFYRCEPPRMVAEGKAKAPSTGECCVRSIPSDSNDRFGRRMWPVRLPHDWCGEYKAAEEKPWAHYGVDFIGLKR